MEMLVNILSYNRPNLTSHKFLESAGIEYRIAVHSEEQLRLYENKKCFSTNSESGKWNQVISILEKEEEGKLICFCDDDITSAETVLLPYRNQMPFLEKGKVPKGSFSKVGEEFVDILKETKRFAEANNYNLIGYSNTGNPWIRAQSKRFSLLSNVDGGLFFARNLPWSRDKKFVGPLDDMHLAMSCIAEFGHAVIDMSCHIVHERHNPGGLGTGSSRRVSEHEHLERIYKEFPGCLTYKETEDGNRVRLNRKKLLALKKGGTQLTLEDYELTRK